jgi:hypothetical protein
MFLITNTPGSTRASITARWPGGQWATEALAPTPR